MTTEPEHPTLSVEALDRINRVCRKFEATWKKGESPLIEDYLGDARGAERSKLPALRGPLREITPRTPPARWDEFGSLDTEIVTDHQAVNIFLLKLGFGLFARAGSDQNRSRPIGQSGLQIT